MIVIIVTSFLSSLRLQKNLWVISTSRKRAPIEPTYASWKSWPSWSTWCQTDPSPETQDPSQYGDQFLDRPHHLITDINTTCNQTKSQHNCQIWGWKVIRIVMMVFAFSSSAGSLAGSVVEEVVETVEDVLCLRLSLLFWLHLVIVIAIVIVIVLTPPCSWPLLGRTPSCCWVARPRWWWQSCRWPSPGFTRY